MSQGPDEAREIGIGLIGAGWMGELHTASYRRVRDHYPDCRARPRLVIGADELEQRARATVERLGYRDWTVDWREVIAHPEVDAVSITAPNHMHVEIATAAAEAGKHFWGEKPLGRFPEETAAIAAAVERAGIRTTVGFNYRHAPAVHHARELIASGELGEVNHYRGFFLADYASHPQGALSWRFRKSLAGLGVLGDLMSHVVDMAHCLLGPLERVSAQRETLISTRPSPSPGAGSHFDTVEGGERGEVENEDYASALARFSSGTPAVLEASRVIVGPRVRMGFELNGTRGALAWDFERMNELELHLPGMPSGDRGYATVHAAPGHGDFARFQPGAGLPMGYGDLKVVEARLFLESVLDGRQREPGAPEALAMARVLSAMERSFESGGWETVGEITASAAH